MRYWLCAAILWLASFLSGAAYRHQISPSHEQSVAEVRRLLASERYAEAETSLRRLVARYPADTETRIALSRVAQDRADWSTVALVLRPIPDSDPRAAAVRITEGDAWLKLNRASSAEICWSRARQIEPENQLAMHRLLYIYGIQLRREPWLRLLWELYDRNQFGMREMIQMMVADHIVWDVEEPLHQMRDFVAADPQDVHSRHALGIYLLRAGQATEAVRELTALCEENRDNTELYLTLTEALLATGEKDKARDALARIPDAAQQWPDYWKHRGSLALLDRQYEDAANDFRRALALKLYDQDAQHKLAQALRFAGDSAAAEPHFRVAALLAKIERLCHLLHTDPVGNVDEMRKIVGYCEELQLFEEARGWVAVGLSLAPADQSLKSARQRLRALPGTSSRRLPAWEALR